MPRPDVGRRMVPVRMDPDLLALIDADTDENTSRSEVIREIIRRHYAA